MSRELEQLLDEYGVSQYHREGVLGAGVSILVIDTGCSAGENAHGLAVSYLLHAPQTLHSSFRGICPEASVEVIDVVDHTAIPIEAVIKHILAGVRKRVDIISISLGTPEPWQPLQDAVNEATRAGILVFAAAGNAGEQGYEFPAACHGAISVGSINRSGRPSPFNTRNDSVIVFAPGEKLSLPVGPNNSLKEFTGTSFATPFAAGVAALVLSKHKQSEPKSRISRHEMVLKLRDASHFQLNCEDHTYVMEKTCVDSPAKEVATRVPERSNGVGVGVVVLGVLLASAILLISRAHL